MSDEWKRINDDAKAAIVRAGPKHKELTAQAGIDLRERIALKRGYSWYYSPSNEWYFLIANGWIQQVQKDTHPWVDELWGELVLSDSPSETKRITIHQSVPDWLNDWKAAGVLLDELPPTIAFNYFNGRWYCGCNSARIVGMGATKLEAIAQCWLAWRE